MIVVGDAPLGRVCAWACAPCSSVGPSRSQRRAGPQNASPVHKPVFGSLLVDHFLLPLIVSVSGWRSDRNCNTAHNSVRSFHRSITPAARAAGPGRWVGLAAIMLSTVASNVPGATLTPAPLQSRRIVLVIGDVRASLGSPGCRGPCWRRRGATCGGWAFSSRPTPAAARSIMRAKPGVVKGDPRSLTKTKGDVALSRCSRRNARSSSPWIGCVLGVPFLTRRTWSFQGWLSITSTAVYTALAPNRFKDFWPE
jgi:hypothetical protein